MAEEAVIFPSQALFMVDRGWQRQRKRKANPTAPNEGELQPWRVPEVTINIAQRATLDKSQSETDRIPTEAKQPNPEKLQFMNYDPSKSKRTRTKPPKKCGTPKAKPNPAPIGPESVGLALPLPMLSTPVPGTVSPLYNCIEPEVSSFQDFLSYYHTRLADATYPISQYLPLKFNPIRTIWYPATVTDDVFLHAILFSSALHFSVISGHRTFQGSELLMRTILDKLNKRIKSGSYSDVTIAAVSCLALCEIQVGNLQKWEVHAAGMSGMIRARGGISSVQGPMHMKLYRADVIGAVDGLTMPHLPRPARRTKSLYKTMVVNSPLSPVISLLLELNLSPTVFDALVDLSSLCAALNVAANELVPIDPFAFDEDTLCISYDLLMSYHQEQGNAEKACLLAGLIFIQTLIRESPFAKQDPPRISQELQTSLSLCFVEAVEIPSALLLWILLMGGLVSSDTAESDWYHTRLRQHRESHHLQLDWDLATLQLKEAFWIDAIHNKLGKEVWDQVDGVI